ncbi:uncharacterized protein BO87DRAFT_393201 [Aspergillus neoniger CBS 115656]|uniref:Aminoglycoside phosphotransferase domain-containing protein n=1 Tax=Aspergillus neoniger (strain CBS 115656) TaxID=1448310 RepID=A0A318ZSE0_ASPNB|nr:hypothetical protein BO87DRAFT_393201 [Aspergillus neoniger CBS 115656]PYH38612.1 hypothetical protein BO87DRAFT_393201 [Aspergillus neoniger CBS 115656]
MDYDDTLCHKCDRTFAPWRHRLFQTDVLREIGQFIDKHRGGVPDELFSPKRGSFNAWLRLLFQDGGSAVIRFPCPGASMFPEEKVQREVAVMQFLEHFTSLPIPHILHHRITEESPKDLGPFIIMEHISNEGDFIDALNVPGRSRDERPMLDPNVSEERLEWVYVQMADIMLQVSRHSFAEIGCIGKADEDDDFDDTWVVKHRPLTFNMNELVQLGGVSPDLLPQSTFKTVSSYYQSLAEMHMIHLTFQRNDAIDSAEDCRTKYIARCLFRKITHEYQFSSDDAAPFRLFCDDLRPGNVLSNAQHQMTGVVDWEFTYVAPTGFAHSPPFWLLLELPELWKQGLGDWAAKYEKVLPVFLRALKDREQAAIDRGIMEENDRLSGHMLKSWESGDFWLNYAARKSWAFDMIYWAKIDRRFFGDGDLSDRIELLTPDERAELEGFVQMKLKAKEEGGLHD